MKKKLYLLLLTLAIFSVHKIHAQVEIPMFEEDEGNVADSSMNQVNLKDLIAGVWVPYDNSWFTSNYLILKKKLSIIRDRDMAIFDYFWFKKSGTIEANQYNPDGKAIGSGIKLNFGGYVVTGNSVEITLQGWSLKGGKFEYRLVYDYEEHTDDTLTLYLIERKLVYESGGEGS